MRSRKIERREFLRRAGVASLAWAWWDRIGETPGTPPADGPLFDANRPEVLALAERVMQRCVLDRTRPPTPPLRHTWIVPGGPDYRGQWIWDTMFVVDLLSILPDKQELIREVFPNYWDFQDRWDEDVPAHARDMITVAIKTAPQEVRPFSQIPILA